jgi:hypothetical protein
MHLSFLVAFTIVYEIESYEHTLETSNAFLRMEGRQMAV